MAKRPCVECKHSMLNNKDQKLCTLKCTYKNSKFEPVDKPDCHTCCKNSYNDRGVVCNIMCDHNFSGYEPMIIENKIELRTAGIEEDLTTFEALKSWLTLPIISNIFDASKEIHNKIYLNKKEFKRL